MVYENTEVFKSVLNITKESILPGESGRSMFGRFFPIAKSMVFINI